MSNENGPINEVAIVRSIESLRGDIRELGAMVNGYMTTTTRDIVELREQARRHSDVVNKVKDEYVCRDEFEQEKKKNDEVRVKLYVINGVISAAVVIINIAIALYSAIGKH